MNDISENAATPDPAPQSSQDAPDRGWPWALWDAAAFALLAAGGGMIALAVALMTPGSVGHGEPRASALFDPAEIETATVAKGDPHAWSYHGETRPGRWAELGEANAACAGREQSPVDLAGGAPAETGGFDLRWEEPGHSVVNNGHTLQVNLANGGAMIIGGKTYRLKQFHFHAPSEHAIEGERAAMEAHFVHEAQDGALAVLGVMMREGDGQGDQFGSAGEAFAQIMAQAPGRAGAAPLPYAVSPAAFLPERRRHLRYQGSLTTPPCSETVLWTVLSEPVTVARADVERFAAIFHGNARPLQPLNRRYLLIGE